MYNMVGSAAALFSGNTMAGFICLYAMLVIVQVATIYAFLYLGGVIEVGVCYNIRQEAFHKLQELPFSYYDRMPVGYLMSRMTSDIQRLAETIGWSLLDLFWGVVMLVMCSVTMLTINWKLGLAVMVVLPPLAVISFISSRRSSRAGAPCARPTAASPARLTKASWARKPPKPWCARKPTCRSLAN